MNWMLQLTLQPRTLHVLSVTRPRNYRCSAVPLLSMQKQKRNIVQKPVLRLKSIKWQSEATASTEAHCKTCDVVPLKSRAIENASEMLATTNLQTQMLSAHLKEENISNG